MRSLIVRILEFLHRLFARKCPYGFDREIGSWRDPDVILSPAPSVARPPRPLVNTDCRRVHVVYSVATKRVQRCDLASQADVVGDALAQAATYFNDHFRCDDPECIRKVGDLLWSGVSCDTNPRVATGAVLVQFRCTVEL